MQIFFLTVESPEKGRLNATETRHCTRVLRHQIGDQIHAIDGKGNLYTARIQQINKESTDLELLQHQPNWGEHGRTLRLIVAPLRLKDRFEWLIEKSVELGVTEIVPLQTQRTDVYKSKFKPERLQTLMLTATKQCKRSRIPTLLPIQPYHEWMNHAPEGLKFIAWCEAEQQLGHFEQDIKPATELSIMIGPEGDFTEEEISMAMAQDFAPILLGNQRLRSETAGLYALSQIKGMWVY